MGTVENVSIMKRAKKRFDRTKHIVRWQYLLWCNNNNALTYLKTNPVVATKKTPGGSHETSNNQPGGNHQNCYGR